MKIYTAMLPENNVIRIKDVDYIPEMDTVILFNNTNGLYINPDNYIISENGVITIKSGFGILSGSSVDVVVIRNLNYIIYTESVDIVRDNLV